MKEPVNIFNKIIEENLSDLKKEMPINIQEPQVVCTLKEIPLIT